MKDKKLNSEPYYGNKNFIYNTNISIIFRGAYLKLKQIITNCLYQIDQMKEKTESL